MSNLSRFKLHARGFSFFFFFFFFFFHGGGFLEPSSVPKMTDIVSFLNTCYLFNRIGLDAQSTYGSDTDTAVLLRSRIYTCHTIIQKSVHM